MTVASVLPTAPLAIEIRKLVFRYGQRVALDDLDLSIRAGQIFALLGPNGSGKSTLFRILATLQNGWSGKVRVLGNDLHDHPTTIRAKLGVVFQAPSLDKKLTVRENLWCQGVLYGLGRKQLIVRISQVAEQLGIENRLPERVETLSGGLQRRVEIAKGLLHRPQLLLMDEPSAGLDPASRLDLWAAIVQLQQVHQVSVVLTTHLLEEADKAHEIAILNEGKCVAWGAPDVLRSELGSQVLTIQPQDAPPVVQWLEERQLSPQWTGQSIKVSGAKVAHLVTPLVESFPDQIRLITVGPPGLEDVFVSRTGRNSWNDSLESSK